MLGAYALLTTLYIWLRSLGAHTVAVGNGETLERLFFRTTPTRDLQDAFHSRAPWLDFAGLLLHVSWFWLPIVYCGALLIFERKRLMEFMAWVLTGSFIAAVAFIFLPLRPPWMEPGIARILLERAFISFTDVDNNQFATLPSMHAGLPVVMGLFCLLRCKRLRWLGWPALAYGIAIGFMLVYLGEHWAIDIVAGYALAGVVAVLFMAPALRRAYAAIPGRPVERAARLNDYLNTRPALWRMRHGAASPAGQAAVPPSQPVGRAA